MSVSVVTVPLVTAIMPTRGRPEMARRALASWYRQKWPRRELVIVDDRDCPSFPDAKDFTGERIQYVKLSARLSVGAKRNLACSMATGEIVVHFDSDDWSTPERIADQVALLRSSGKQVVGYHSLVFHETRSIRVLTDTGMRPASAWWRWRDKDGLATGTALCYWRAWWKQHPFADENRAQDDWFYADALAAQEAIAVDGREMICAANHGDNISGRLIGGAEWEELPGNPYGD